MLFCSKVVVRTFKHTRAHTGQITLPGLLKEIVTKTMKCGTTKQPTNKQTNGTKTKLPPDTTTNLFKINLY